MKQLSAETVRLLSSAQVITSVLSAVKELVENSLDAGADNVEVKLDNFGLDKIEVRDNGAGISPDDVPVMGQRHFTSKLKDIGDLASVTSYGFRGEALASLCSVSDVTVTTKRSVDNVSMVHTLDCSGVVTSSRPSHLGNGTTITATHLFKTVPVRRQCYNSSNRKKDELKKIEDLFMCYGFINPGVRFALSHNKKIVWQKNRVQSSRIALLNTVGSSVMGQMGAVEIEDHATRIKICGFLPKIGSDLQLVGRHHSNDRCWMYVNKRPVQLKEVEKLIKQHYCKNLSDGTNVRHLVACLSFEVPTEAVDVNLEPDKGKVLLQNRDAVLELLTEILEDFYRNDGKNNKNVTETDSAKKSSLESAHLQPHKEGDVLGEAGKEESDRNDLNQRIELTLKEVRKFGASGDRRQQLRRDSQESIEAFLFKELSNSSIDGDTIDQTNEYSDETNERTVLEERRNFKIRRGSFGHCREEADLVHEESLKENRKLEMENNSSNQSRVKLNWFSTEPVAGESSSCKEQYNISEQQKDAGRSYEHSELSTSSDKLGNCSTTLGEVEQGDRSDGGLVQEESESRTASGVTDQPSFSLFEDNIFLDSQMINTDSGGNGRSGEADRIEEEGDVMAAKQTEQENRAQKDKPKGDHEVMPLATNQSFDGLEISKERSQFPEVRSCSSDDSKRKDLVNAEGGEMAWSKGVLLGSKTIPVEPVKLLIPGGCNSENDGVESRGQSIDGDSVGLGPHDTNAKTDPGMRIVGGNIEGISSDEPLTTLQTNPVSNLSVVEGLISKEDKTSQNADDDNSHQNSTTRGQDSGTALPSADHDKVVVSSNNDSQIVSSQGACQKSGEILTKSLLDRKGSPGENTSASTSPKSHYDLVHGTPLKRPQDAYTHFLKEYRPKVGECFPTIEKESMDVLLKETWRDLPQEKKKMYETLAEKDQERYDKQITDSCPAKRQKTLDGEVAIPNPTKKKKGRKVPLITNQGFIDGMLASQENRRAAVTEIADVIPSKEIPFTINSLKDFMKESRQNIEEDSVSLVGRLPSHHVWITSNQSHLSVLHHLRAEELVLYRRLMATHTLASAPLDVPLVLSESILGCWSNWVTLLSMKSSPVSEDFVSIYTDERLIKNGFKVRRLIDQETRDVRLEVTSISDYIPCYGIGDLQEILKKISKNAAVRLGQCRPLKVTNYLKSEAVRISRSRPKVLIQDDVVDLITSLTKISQHPVTCLHEKQVFYNFFSFVEES